MPDAFDGLRIGRNAMTPPDNFAERLLGQIREELGMTTTATQLRELYYATFTVGDLDRARQFFHALFGWEFNPPHRVLDREYVNIRTTVAMGMNDDPDTANIWFVANDLAEAAAKVVELGGTAEVDLVGGSAVCTDDQGVRFGLSREEHGPVTAIAEIPEHNVTYVTITVPDELRARRFFGEVLGWRFDGGLANPGFVTVPTGVGRGEPGHLLFIKVDDVEAAAARVRELGGTAGPLQEWPSGRGIECTDDQGTVFWLNTPAPGY